MRQIATAFMIIVTLFVSALYLPMLYEKIFFERIEKTHLLFSPVTKRFIFKEKIVGPVPPEAVQKAEDHHAEIAYRDAHGTYYTRVEFEKHLPFIYYKNMELWGLLPLELEGRRFTKADIKAKRQVLELKSGDISDRRPHTPLWPLLESNPGQARLVFPEDRFRMTADAMQFINADDNREDEELTAAFTKALVEKGFKFPARSVNGKFTILKPFDEGIFIVDDAYQVFHVKRRDGQPVVVRTPIDPALKTRHIKITENRRRQYYGLLLDGYDKLHLLTYDRYQLVSLPLEDYDPDRMDFKLLINPLHLTAVWSNDTLNRAVAMDKDYRPLERYTHRMSRATPTPMQRLHALLFPFSLRFEAPDDGFLRPSWRMGSVAALAGLLACCCGYATIHWLRRRALPDAFRLTLVAVTGIYGLIAVTFIGSET
jgi:hypothetical protein